MKGLLLKRQPSSERVYAQSADSSDEPSICNSNDGDDVRVDSVQLLDDVGTFRRSSCSSRWDTSATDNLNEQCTG